MLDAKEWVKLSAYGLQFLAQMSVNGPIAGGFCWRPNFPGTRQCICTHYVTFKLLTPEVFTLFHECWHFSHLKVMETEVRDLKNPATVNETVWWLEITMAAELTVMEVDHSLKSQTDTDIKCCNLMHRKHNYTLLVAGFLINLIPRLAYQIFHLFLTICLSITLQHSQLNKKITWNSRICKHT